MYDIYINNFSYLYFFFITLILMVLLWQHCVTLRFWSLTFNNAVQQLLCNSQRYKFFENTYCTTKRRKWCCTANVIEIFFYLHNSTITFFFLKASWSDSVFPGADSGAVVVYVVVVVVIYGIFSCFYIAFTVIPWVRLLFLFFVVVVVDDVCCCYCYCGNFNVSYLCEKIYLKLF